jgi:hypothetical protein
MPSPFGYKRGANTYYEHPGTGRYYVYNWDGVSVQGSRAAETRGLGCSCDFVDVTARLHKSLSGYEEYPVAMSTQVPKGSVLRPGPEQTPLYDGMGFFGRSSDSEKRLLLLGGVALAGYLALRKYGKGR